MRELIHALRCDCQVRLCILAFSLVFTAYLSNAVVLRKNLPFIFQVRMVLKPLVSLKGRLAACSAKVSVYTQEAGVSREMFSGLFEALYTEHCHGARLLHPVVFQVVHLLASEASQPSLELILTTPCHW